jgi:molybdenum cofactor cytidylyltransferase
MGRPKLTLDLAGRLVIARLLDALDHPAIAATAVVFRRSDEQLRDVLQPFDVIAVQPPRDPPDMRHSVEYGVAAIRNHFAPDAEDAWILIPADHPVLDGDVINELVDAWQTLDADIMVPVHEGKRGHPAFFRWTLADRLSEIPDDQGLNWLLTLDGVTVCQHPVTSDSILLDLDTPEDLQRLQSRFDPSN